MACIHKFYKHQEHLSEEQALLPNWPVKTLIIGTFNPENVWHSGNQARYFYGRDANHLWTVLPRFAGETSILNNDVTHQIGFLKRHEIGLTDILISIDDAEIGDEVHKARIQTVKDKEVELFSRFTWNTNAIINYIIDSEIKAVYFTYLGDKKRKTVRDNSFEEQTRKVETACAKMKIFSSRLHTPSAQGLGEGSPRENVLIHRWYNENGADRFPFLDKNFDLDNFPITSKHGLTDEQINEFF